MSNKRVKLEIELSDAQFEMLMDCMQTTATFYKSKATALESENTNYANRINYLRDAIDKAKKEIEI